MSSGEGSVAAEYHSVRFAADPRRTVVWNHIANYLQEWIGESDTTLELGAGYCELSNALRNAKRIAIDQSPLPLRSAAPGVETIVGDVLRIREHGFRNIDAVLASNLLEHIENDSLHTLMSSIREILVPGGRLVLIQPNYRLCASKYFDDYTHRSIHSHVSLPDLLQSCGFSIVRVEPRFLPFSMKSRLAIASNLAGIYLRLPYRPLAGQMLVVAERPA